MNRRLDHPRLDPTLTGRIDVSGLDQVSLTLQRPPAERLAS